MNNRASEALAAIEDQAREAGLFEVATRLALIRGKLDAERKSAEELASVCEDRASVLKSFVLPIEILGPSRTAAALYLRAAGALRGRFCARCADPTEGECVRRLPGMQLDWPVCNRCGSLPVDETRT